ncbi:DUF357 domain-containing protein [Candidatus Woesearchaeota archaeon]|nr:DUF357 domain-containing protein [Candidatus Woesearchaeota archaeon]
MENKVTEERLEKYFELTEEAYKKAKDSKQKTNLGNAREKILDMVKRYIDDAHYFKNKNDIVTAFASLSYAHGFLDAGALLGIFDVRDSKLFIVD